VLAAPLSRTADTSADSICTYRVPGFSQSRVSRYWLIEKAGYLLNSLRDPAFMPKWILEQVLMTKFFSARDLLAFFRR
jgi:hypothetical protein